MTLPKLGVGIVYIPGLEPVLGSGDSPADYIEIEPQTVWHFDKQRANPYVLPHATLDHLASLNQKKIIHSVGCGLGGTYQPDDIFISALNRDIEALDAPWVSEHLAITHINSPKGLFNTGFMLPSLQTVEGAQTAATTITNFKNKINVPLAVETAVNYMKPRPGEISDGEFISLTTTSADCGILLDLHNIWTNQQNGRQTVDEFLSGIPLDRVWEIHLGGGFEFEGYWLDAHSGNVPEAVLDITSDLITSLPNLKAITYEIFPSFLPLFGVDAVRRELEKIQEIWQKLPVSHSSIHHTKPSLEINTNIRSITPRIWEETLGEVVTHGTVNNPLAQELTADRSIGLVQRLIWRFRAGAVTKSLPVLTKLFLAQPDPGLFESLLDAYLKSEKPMPFASEEAHGFIAFLRSTSPSVPFLEEILCYEEASIKSLLSNEPQYVRMDFNPRTLLQALAEGYIPEELEQGDYEVEVTP